MKIFYSKAHKAHYPPFEVFDGGVQVTNFEMPERAERILAALHAAGMDDIHPPDDFGLEPIRAVHDADYLDFLRTAYDEWMRTPTAYEKTALLPATFPPGGWRRKPSSLLGRAGYYMMDLSAPIASGTYPAALQAAYCALSGARALTHGERTAFALCRPPGHHAGRANCGGYCYINNAAVAAHWLSARGRVAVLDIDYHAGNGTQDIFYTRADVLTLSIHADPDFEYPYYSGYANETGAGPGLGFHQNYPLPAGTDDAAYLAALDDALGRIRAFWAAYLVVSAGMDLYDGDPLGTFHITRAGIGEIGRRIGALGLPTLVVMEGGYNNDALGENMVALLRNV
ncbi:MAG: histone deacetylase family protein [Anaerolineales bacterium]